MRRFSYGVTTDKHPLYGVFMGKLSQCIFKWDEEDLQNLKEAKRQEMIRQKIPNPTDDDVMRRLTKAELNLHCKRVTRGVAETTDLISRLIQSLDGSKSCDTLGVPLFNGDEMNRIWAYQSRHVARIQDPPGFKLYTEVGTLMKGGKELKKYRCARGSVSLENFHLHMNRMVPGMSNIVFIIIFGWIAKQFRLIIHNV